VPGRPGSGRWLVAAVIVVGVAVTLPLAIAAGAVAYRLSRTPVPRAEPARGHYLADASSTRIEAAATSRGLRCGPPPLSIGFGGAPPVRVCQRASGVGVASVAVVEADSDHVAAVTADAGGGPADDPANLALLQAIIGAAVAGDDAAADDAWLTAHFDQSGMSQTVVNGVSLRLTVRGTFRSLVIVPAT
jgi:hypothetical protein